MLVGGTCEIILKANIKGFVEDRFVFLIVRELVQNEAQSNF